MPNNEEFIVRNPMDHDRGVGSGSKTINGVDIDLGFVAMAAGYSSYNTRFGKAKDPTLHSNYKEFWSDKMPYQAGEFRKPMDPKDWQEIADATVAFDKAYSNLRNGENSAFPKWGKEELQKASGSSAPGTIEWQM